MITYQREAARALWPEIRPLLARHWEEIASFDDIPLDPDEERYNLMDEAGLMRCFTARADGVLIGYGVFVVGSNMHYRSSKLAVQDVLFVLPEYRRSRAGLGLIRFTGKQLREEGVLGVYQHEKTSHPQLGAILSRLGYSVVENIWVKRLDKGD